MLIAGCSLTSLVAEYSTLADILTSFRHLYVIGAVGCSIVLFLGRRRLFASVAVVAALANFTVVARALPTDSGCEPTLTVLTLNALGPDNDVDATEQLLVDSGADIVVVTELARALDQRLKQRYAYHFTFPHEGTAGMGVFSRFALSHTSKEPGEWFPQLLATANVDGRTITVLAVHPPPPGLGDSDARRNREIVGIASRVGSLGRPIIVAGDLNLTRQSPHFQPLLDAGLVDSRIGHGVAGTWPAPLPFRVGIDHVLHTPELQTCSLEVSASVGSDHRPLTARLR